MKSRNGLRKPIRDIGADELKKTPKLKPQGKLKNVKNLLYKEIEEDDGIGMAFHDLEADDLGPQAEADENE